MQVTLEGLAPYDRSVQWRIHYAYFAQRGIGAWKDGEIPHHSTNNYGVARQHAEFITALVLDGGVVGPGEPITVLEIGGGIGIFAANFLRALDEGCGAAGREVASRLRYVFSDHSERSLREASAAPHLRALVASGRVVPALHDLRAPDRLTTLDGAPIDDAPVAILSNYVACAVPTKHFQRHPEGWRELYVEVRADTDQVGIAPTELLAQFLDDATQFNMLRNLALFYDWRDANLEEAVPPRHARILEHLAGAEERATVGYPLVFMDYLLEARARLAPGGLVIITDYGGVRLADLQGLRDRRPQFYGNTVNHEIYFGIFDSLAACEGWGSLRTDDALASLHMMVLRPEGPLPEPVRDAAEHAYLSSTAVDDALDFAHAARKCMEGRDFRRAIRFFRRAIAVERDNPDLLYRLGSACIEAGYYDVAVGHLERGLALEPDNPALDFEFQIGRSLCLSGRGAEALGWYERSLARTEHPVTHTNVAVLHESEGRFTEAYRSLRRALALDPQNKRALERMEQLKRVWWTATVADVDAQLGAPPGADAPSAPAAPEQTSDG